MHNCPCSRFAETHPHTHTHTQMYKKHNLHHTVRRCEINFLPNEGCHHLHLHSTWIPQSPRDPIHTHTHIDTNSRLRHTPPSMSSQRFCFHRYLTPRHHSDGTAGRTSDWRKGNPIKRGLDLIGRVIGRGEGVSGMG